MILAIQSIIICAVFSLLIYLLGRKDPIKAIMSYPPAIRKRVENLPQYKNTIHKEKKNHILKKLISIPLFVAFIAFLSWIAGARTFESAFIHSFLLFLIVNLWDLIVLDWIWFCNSKRAIIPGTEDMTSAYKEKLFHLRGFTIGLAIGLVVSFLAASVVALINIL